MSEFEYANEVECISFNNLVGLFESSDNPTIGGGYAGPSGSLLIRHTGATELWQKQSDLDTDWIRIATGNDLASLSGAINILSGDITFLSGITDILSGNIDTLSADLSALSASLPSTLAEVLAEGNQTGGEHIDFTSGSIIFAQDNGLDIISQSVRMKHGSNVSLDLIVTATDGDVISGNPRIVLSPALGVSGEISIENGSESGWGVGSIVENLIIGTHGTNGLQLATDSDIKVSILDDARVNAIVLSGGNLQLNDFVFPLVDGISGDVLVTDGNHNLSFASISGNSVEEIDDLTDVDTTTYSPTTGDVLRFDGTNWIPSSAPSLSGVPVSNNILYAYDGSIQPLLGISTFQIVTFDTLPVMEGWSYSAGTFTSISGGAFMGTFDFNVEKAGGGNVQVTIVIKKNGIEIPGSHNGMDITSNNTAFSISRTVLFLTSPNDTLTFEIAGNSLTAGIIPPPAIGGVNTPVGCSILIRKIL